jgi:hypothetical protein
MTAPDAHSAGVASGDDKSPPELVAPALRPTRTPLSETRKDKSIHASPAVGSASRQDDEELLRELRTSPTGLTQAEAEMRA